jgi:integrase/recombinase XerD
VSALSGQVVEYLRLRRALGFKLKREGRMLPQFVSWLDAAGAQTITVELAVAWARLPEGVQPIEWARRLGVVRGFARWLHTIDPATQIPPPDVFGARQQRPVPYVYSAAEISGLLQATRTLRPPLRAATHEALFGLLAATGLRVGESIALTRSDVDLTAGVITIRHAKFDRPRLVPLHPSVTSALHAYAARRDQICTAPKADTFFLSTVGTALSYSRVRQTFAQISTAIGLRTATRRPRIHDLRHSLVVNTLIGWQRDGVDVGSQMVLLSTYLGHVKPASTYWYVSAVPELMQLVAVPRDSRSITAHGARS